MVNYKPEQSPGVGWRFCSVLGSPSPTSGLGKTSAWPPATPRAATPQEALSASAPHWPPALPEATYHRLRLLTKGGELPQGSSQALCGRARLMA